MDIIGLLFIITLSYLVGSFPTAIVVSKIFFGFDIRQRGSGNMGSTNAFRILGWKWGLTVQLIDLVKGIAAVILVTSIIPISINFGSSYFENSTIVKMIAGLSAVCGHIWTILAGFRGGKGINTAAGMLIAIAPVDVGIALVCFILAVIFSGYISLGSLTGALALPSSLLIRYNLLNIPIPGYHILLYFSALLALLLIFTHRANIVRLLKGTENHFAKLQVIKYKFSNHRK